KRRLLRHLHGDAGVDRGVVIDAVAAADYQRGRQDRVPREGDARLDAVLIGLDEGIGVFLAGERPYRIVGPHGGDGAVAGSDVQVDQAAVLFDDRRAVFVAHAGVQRETGIDAPIIGEITVPGSGAEVFVGIAERDGTGIGDAQQKA